MYLFFLRTHKLRNLYGLRCLQHNILYGKLCPFLLTQSQISSNNYLLLNLWIKVRDVSGGRSSIKQLMKVGVMPVNFRFSSAKI